MSKFELQETPEVKGAVRTVADRISKETRRARRDFGGRTQHFALDPRVIEDLSKEGHLCFINDDLKGRLSYVESIGYRYVTNGEAYGDREGLDPNDRVKVRFGVADKNNNPQDTYLMLQPWEFYNEDQAALVELTNAVDEQINAGGDDVDAHYGKRMTYKK